MQKTDTLIFPTENDMIEFVAAAFPNCIFDDMAISGSPSKSLLDAIGRVAHSVVVSGPIRLSESLSPDDSLSLVRKFRKVKVSFVSNICCCSASALGRCMNSIRGLGAPT